MDEVREELEHLLQDYDRHMWSKAVRERYRSLTWTEFNLLQEGAGA